MKIPAMTDAEADSFERQVLALFKAGWDTEKIRSWAVGFGSGFSRFWTSVEHAQTEVNAICRAYNRDVAARNREVRRSALAKIDPAVLDLAKRIGAKVRFR